MVCPIRKETIHRQRDKLDSSQVWLFACFESALTMFGRMMVSALVETINLNILWSEEEIQNRKENRNNRNLATVLPELLSTTTVVLAYCSVLQYEQYSCVVSLVREILLAAHFLTLKCPSSFFCHP